MCYVYSSPLALELECIFRITRAVFHRCYLYPACISPYISGIPLYLYPCIYRYLAILCRRYPLNPTVYATVCPAASCIYIYI